MTYDRDYDRDVIVEERDGTGVGTILGIILAVVVVLAIIWFFFLGGMGPANPGTDGNTDQTQIENNIQVPDDQPVVPPAEGGGELQY